MGLWTLVSDIEISYAISMRNYRYFLGCIGLLALLLTSSSEPAFAQKKKMLQTFKNELSNTGRQRRGGKGSSKGSSQLNRSASVTTHTPGSADIPSVSLPNMPMPSMELNTHFTPTGAAVTPQFSPSNSSNMPTGVPDVSPVEDTGTNLTGRQVLAAYFPTWRQELGGMFSAEQLDAVERAMAATDDWLFVRGEDGELQARNKDEWDYEARFLTILQDSGVSFTEKQIRQLIGARGMRGFTFKTYFFRTNATGFSCAKGMKPRGQIYRDGNLLSREEMTPEEIQEVIIGKGLARNANHPAVIAYMKENRLRAEDKTAEEYVALAEQYPTKPRSNIWRGGHRLTREEMTPEEIQEVIIGLGLNTHRNHPAVIAYMQENRLQAEAKTAEEYVTLARQYDRKPRAVISRNGHILSREEMTPEEIQEVHIGNGLSRYRNHPAVIAYMQKNRLQAEAQPIEQLYTALVDYIKDYGHYPMRREGSLYINIYGRLRHYQSTMVDGKYTDPWLQKIYELKTAVQNAPEGKFTLTPDGQGGYVLEIEEPAAEELDVTAPQPVEEVAPAAPSPHTIRLRINEETKNLVLATRDHAALERREFPGWLRSMHSGENFPQIVDQHTFDALHVLNRAINFDYRNRQNRRAVTYLLETVNNYVGLLGDQEAAFYKLMYRGTLEPGILPRADHFHVVAETQGLSWDGELAPQIEQVNRAYAQSVKRGETPSVYLDGDEEMVTALGIVGRVDIQTVKQDLENVIANLLPPGYSVRMGLHELGISGSNLDKFQKGRVHIHLENASAQADEEGLQIDHSISLDVKVGRFAGWWDANARQFYPYSNAQIAQNYRTLFGSFLEQEAKDKLNELAE